MEARGEKKMVAALTRSIGMNDTNRSEEPQWAVNKY
jgi:hypothetical protein